MFQFSAFSANSTLNLYERSYRAVLCIRGTGHALCVSVCKIFAMDCWGWLHQEPHEVLGSASHLYVLKVASIDGLSFLVACHCTIFIANLLLCILGK